MLRVKKHPETAGNNNLIETSEMVCTKILDQTEKFSNPSPTIEAYKTDITAAQTKQKELDLLEAKVKEVREEVNNAFQKLDRNYSQLATYVEGLANGNREIILAAGMVPYSTSRLKKPMQQPENLHVTNSAIPKQISLAWNPVKSARSYVVRASHDISNNESWEISKLCTRSSVTIENMDSGTTMWFQVSALGTDGEGEPSQPITKVIS